MEISSIKKYKGTTYEVELDNERKIYLHIDIIADFGLRSGMSVEREELKKIIYASNFHRAYNYALYQLDYKDYSAEEMHGKLIEKYKSEKLCLAVVSKLAKAGLIDDSRYAEKLARKLVVSKKYGFYRAKREIMLKGIDEYTALEALEPYSETYTENLEELLRNKHYRLLTDSSDKKSVEKVKNALSRYGYSFEEINCAVRNYFENEELRRNE